MPADLNWLDIAALIVIAVFSFDGLIKGLVISVFNIAGFFAAIYIAKVTSTHLAEYIIENTVIDESIEKYLLGKINDSSLPVSQALKIMGGGSTNTEGMLASALILILAFIVLFVFAKICLALIAGMLDDSARLPVIKHFNRLGGLLFGAFKGVLILYVFFAAMTPVIPALSPANSIVMALNSSIFAANFYKYNFIVPWFKENLYEIVMTII